MESNLGRPAKGTGVRREGQRTARITRSRGGRAGIRSLTPCAPTSVHVPKLAPLRMPLAESPLRLRYLLAPLWGTDDWAESRQLPQHQRFCPPPPHHAQVGLSLWQKQAAGSRRQRSWEGTGGFVLSASSQVGGFTG